MGAAGVDGARSVPVPILILALGVTVGAILLGMWGVTSGSRLVVYTGAVLGLASVTYLVAGRSLTATRGPTPPAIHPRYLRGLDVAIFAAIPVCVLIARAQPIGLPWEYSVLVAAIAAALLVRSVLGPSLIALFQLLLIATLERATIWYSAPVIGADSRAHADMTAYIVRNGTPVPNAVSYYHDYPGGHLMSSVVVFLTGLDVKPALFVALAGSGIVGLLVVYILTRRLFAERLRSPVTAALLATFIVAFSLWHRQRTALPIAQTLGLLFVPLLLYVTLYRSAERRFVALGVLAIATATISHNTTPVVMVLAFGTYALGELVMREPGWRRRLRGLLPVGAVLGFLSLFVWITTGYIHYHIGRIFDIFYLHDPITKRLSEPIGDANAGSGASDTVAAGFTDPGLYIGFDIMMMAVVVGMFGYLVFTMLITTGHWEELPAALTVMAGLVLCLVTAGFIVGSGNIGRVFPVTIVVVAPVFGYASAQLLGRQPAGTIIAILLVVSFPLVPLIGVSHGITHPGGSPVDSTERPGRYLTHADAAALDYARTHTRTVYADFYAYSSVPIQERNGARIQTPVVSLPRRTALPQRLLSSLDGRLLYRPRHPAFAEPPSTYEQLYDAGDTRVLNPVSLDEYRRTTHGPDRSHSATSSR